MYPSGRILSGGRGGAWGIHLFNKNWVHPCWAEEFLTNLRDGIRLALGKKSWLFFTYVHIHTFIATPKLGFSVTMPKLSYYNTIIA